ncbi:MAG: FHA domain-containing protein [Chloroflexales bacterium]
MKISRFAPTLLLGLALVTMLGPGPMRAQGTSQIRVIHTATEPRGDGLGLKVYFALRDAEGNAIPKNTVRLAQQGLIDLVGSENAAAQATVGAPQTPIKVLLLMDASGSMRPIIGAVRDAAKKAVAAAPETALLGVAQFSQLGPDENLNLLATFTKNRQLASGAIDAIDPQPNAPTCLYNAGYQGIEALKAAEEAPQERQAIILFTDGKDDSGKNTPCSTRSVTNVIAGAQERGIPLYTIGLCSNTACSNLEKTILQDMATKTGGVSATGEQDKLADLFQAIMDDLNSQWVAEAVVYPHQGPNQGVLSVQENSGAQKLTGTFSFNADKDYAAPPSFEIIPTHNAERDSYILNIKVANPASIEQVILEVWSNGALLNDGRSYTAQDLAKPVEVPTKGMVAGKQYCFRIKATGRGNVELKGPKGEPFLTEQCVNYEPRIGFDITSVDPDWDNNKLRIAISVRGVQAPLFEGQITDKNGQTIATIQRSAPNDANNLVLDLPPAFSKAAPESEFQVALTLNGSNPPVDGKYGFKVTPPNAPPPVWWFVGLGVGLILAVGAVAFLLGRKRNPRGGGILAPAPIFNAPTRELGSPNSPVPPVASGSTTNLRLRITVVKTTAQGLQGRNKVITKDDSPFVIGRSEAVQFPIDDKEISRNHAQLTIAGREVFITDLGGRNGTSVQGKPLSVNARTPLSLPAEVGLGHNTVIRIEAV